MVSSKYTYVIISLKDCTSCNFNKVVEIIKMLKKISKPSDQIQLLVKEKVNIKEMNILKKKYSSENILNLNDYIHIKNQSIPTTPYLIVSNNEDSTIIYKNNLLSLNEKLLTSIFNDQIVCSKSTALSNNFEILNIAKSTLDLVNNRLFIFDDVQDKIFSVNLQDGSISLIYTSDKIKEYIKSKYHFSILKNMKKPETIIESFIPDNINKDNLNIIIRTFEIDIEINHQDTIVNYLPRLILLKVDLNEYVENYNKRLNHGKFYFNFEYIIGDKINNYVTGKNIPLCNDYPYSEIADSTYILFKFSDTNFENFKPLLTIQSIINVTNKSFYSFFASEIITNKKNDFALYSSLNRTYITFNIINDSVKNIRNIIPTGAFESYYENVNSLNLTPKELINNPAIFKINTKYYFFNMLCSENNIAVFLIEKNNDDEIISNLIQFYNFEGKFINEFTYNYNDKDPIIESNMVGIDNEKLYILNKQENKGWSILEFLYK
jgi:hypothetical protein